MNKKDLIAHIKGLGGKANTEIFSVPLGALKILPEFNLRIDYDLEPLVTYIKSNGAKFPPLKLQLIDDELYIDEGHRRYMACIEAGLDLDATRLMCYVDTDVVTTSPAQRIANQISSNSGKRYNNIELMLVCKELAEKYNWESKDIFLRLGISQSKYSNLKKLFGASKKLILALSSAKLTYSELVDAIREGVTEEQLFEYIRQKDEYEESLTNPEPVTDTAIVVSDAVNLSDMPADLQRIITESDTEVIDAVLMDDGNYYKPITEPAPAEPNKPNKPNKPKPPGSKPDFKYMCERIVAYDTEEVADHIVIRIPVADYHTIMADLEKSSKKKN
jgi:hypothetical protein